MQTIVAQFLALTYTHTHKHAIYIIIYHRFVMRIGQTRESYAIKKKRDSKNVIKKKDNMLYDAIQKRRISKCTLL